MILKLTPLLVLSILQSDMSNDRLAIVKKAWAKVSEGAASVSMESIVAKYNAPAHPRVTSREKRAETVMNDFVELIGGKSAGGNISEQAFLRISFRYRS